MDEITDRSDVPSAERLEPERAALLVDQIARAADQVAVRFWEDTMRALEWRARQS